MTLVAVRSVGAADLTGRHDDAELGAIVAPEPWVG
jgi:hypothetical protein